MNAWADVVFYGLMLLLPLSALVARRLPLGSTLKMAAAWVAIFAAGYIVVTTALPYLPH